MRARHFLSLVSLIVAAAVPVGAHTNATLAGNIPFELSESGAIVIPVVVNGAGAKFLLDTGSNRSAVSNRLATRLGLDVVAHTNAVSSNATTANAVVRIAGFALGALKKADLLAAVIPGAQLDALAPGIDGLIGQDVLLNENYTLDYRHKRLTWDTPAPGADAATRLTLRADEGRYLVALPQSKNGLDVLWFVPDSGASAFVIFSHDGTPRLQAMPLAGPVGVVTANGSSQMQGVLIKALRVGPQTFEGQPAVVVDRSEADASGDGLLPLCAFASVTFNGREGYLIARGR